jgi:hypothetical protein
MEYYTVYHGYLFFVIQPWKMATFEERRPSFGHLATLQKKIRKWMHRFLLARRHRKNDEYVFALKYFDLIEK